MNLIPHSIIKYIRSLWISEMILTYFHISPDGLLSSWGGHPRHYGLRDLTAEQLATEQITFLEGLLPVTHTQILEFVTVEQGKVAHVHLIPFQEGTWVLMFDATAEHERQQKMQQRANELSILTYRQADLLQQFETARTTLLQEKQQLEQLSQQKSELIASLSHELRSPLTSLMSYTDLLSQVKAADEEEKNYLSGVRGNVNHLLNLVDNVLNQASLEAAQFSLHPIPCDIRQFTQELKQLLLSSAQEKGLQLCFELADTLPARLKLDELRLRQVFINLITNALKFTEQGSITLKLDWAAEWLQFAVIDTGPGIAPDAREAIFQPFHREQATLYKKGTGLGLSITRQLIELMDGHIQVSTAPNHQGSMFHGQIRAECVQTEPRPKNKQPTQATILVAEDCTMIHTLIELYLTEAGYAVLNANDGEEALILAQKQPDLVLIDLHMPKQDGDVVVQQLRAQQFNKPIIAISASDFEQDRYHALNCGCNDYLTKPIEVSKLLSMIEYYLTNDASNS